MEPSSVQTSISSFKENFDLHHKNFFFSMKRVFKPGNRRKVLHSKSKSLLTSRSELREPDRKNEPLKPMNPEKQQKALNIEKKPDQRTERLSPFLRPLVENRDLLNSYGFQKQTQKARQMKKKPSGFDCQAEEKTEDIGKRSSFCDKILMENSELELVERLGIAEKTIEFLRRENSILRTENSELKAKNSEFEAEILAQKRQIQEVIEQYKSFINKLMNDKKELSLNCERLFREKNQDFSLPISEKEDLSFSQSRNSLDRKNDEKSSLLQKISVLESEVRTYRERIERLDHDYLAKMASKEEEYYQSYNSLEVQVREALTKKDEVIRQLNTILSTREK